MPVAGGTLHTPKACPPTMTKRSIAHPHAGSNGKSNLPCRWFPLGHCKYGDNCRFSHVVEVSTVSGDTYYASMAVILMLLFLGNFSPESVLAPEPHFAPEPFLAPELSHCCID